MRSFLLVIPGLVPGIHVDGRHMAGNDDKGDVIPSARIPLLVVGVADLDDLDAIDAGRGAKFDDIAFLRLQ